MHRAMALPFDPGTPLPAFPAGAEQGLALSTRVCAGTTCTRLHLRAAEVRDRGVAGRATAVGGEGLSFELDVGTGQFEGADDRARAWLASERGAWLAPWIEDNATLLRARFDWLRGQEANEPADARPAPEWKPAVRILHQQLFPYDFAPMVRQGDQPWAIVDGCCPDPACACEDVVLAFCPLDGASIEVVGRLGDRKPEKASAAGRALWEAVHADADLVELLRERRDDIRSAGPFIVGAAYEKARLARRTGAPPAVDGDGGYLQGGAIPEGLVRRLFDTSARLHAARVALAVAWQSWIHVEVRGAFARQAWALVDDDPARVELFATLDDETPWLVFAVAPREEASWASRRQRCALGLPLLGGTSLPMVDRVLPDQSFHPPDADDVRLALALAEALLAAPHDEVLDVSVAPRVFEHHVELDAGALDVRLTASHAEAPWDDEQEEEGGDDLDEGEEDEDEDGDEEDASALSGDPLMEAFTDATLDRGLPREVVKTARKLLHSVVGYASQEGALLFDQETWVRFLEDYAPRKVLLDEDDITRAPAALRALVEWLGEVGHVHPRQFRSALDRSLPVFQKRARDPRNFSMAKSLFAEMRTAGVDLGNQAEIDGFLALKNAAPQRELPSSPAKVSRSPDRWSPAPGQPPPAPTDPCGCGSGRRYRKCCMPR